MNSMDSQLKFGPYSPIRKAGNYYFISGQVGVGGDKKAGKDIVSQCRQVLHNLAAVLKTHDLTPADVVKTTIFLQDMADFTQVNDIYTGFFPEPRPARSCIQVAGLPAVADNTLLIEIEAVAYKDEA